MESVTEPMEDIMKKLLRKVVEPRNDETGFSLLELVVAIGILLVLTVGGLIGYSAISKNAKEAAVETAASDVMTAAMVNDSDVDDETTVEGAGQSWMDTAKDRKTIIVESKKVGSCIVVTAKHENGYETERMAGENCSDSTNDGGGVISPGDGSEDGDNNGEIIGSDDEPFTDDGVPVTSAEYTFEVLLDGKSATGINRLQYYEMWNEESTWEIYSSGVKEYDGKIVITHAGKDFPGEIPETVIAIGSVTDYGQFPGGEANVTLKKKKDGIAYYNLGSINVEKDDDNSGSDDSAG